MLPVQHAYLENFQTNQQRCEHQSATFSPLSLTQLYSSEQAPSSNLCLFLPLRQSELTPNHFPNSLILWHINPSWMSIRNCRNLKGKRKSSSSCDKQGITLAAKNNTHIQRQQISLFLLLSKAKKSFCSPIWLRRKKFLLFLQPHALPQTAPPPPPHTHISSGKKKKQLVMTWVKFSFGIK